MHGDGVWKLLEKARMILFNSLAFAKALYQKMQNAHGLDRYILHQKAIVASV